jgi:hypothetical protein
LFLVVDPLVPINPSANIPLVLFPAADPHCDAELAAPTPLAVLVQQAYVYLFRVAVLVKHPSCPKANMPFVLFPTADPPLDAALATPTPDAVLASVAYVYLLRVVVLPTEGLRPIAKMPTVPSGPPTLTLHPQLRADVAPNADGDGMSGSLKLG